MNPNQQTGVVGSDAQLAELFDVYRLADGISDRDGLFRQAAGAARRPALAEIAMLDPGRSVNFVWRGVQWWPLFQFDGSMRVRTEVVCVVQEFTDIVADWEIASWFATPNGWLDGATPLSRVLSNSKAVLQAARADRFVTVG